jgi:hypothetical protein
LWGQSVILKAVWGVTICTLFNITLQTRRDLEGGMSLLQISLAQLKTGN